MLYRSRAPGRHAAARCSIPLAGAPTVIVSHRHRFIFLKTRKTAGTSVEIALSEYLGPDDVITAIGAADEALRRERGWPGPQHDRWPLHLYRRPELARLVRTRRPARAYNHMPAAEVRRLVGEEVWTSYRKVTTVRNPFDAVVSFYHWRIRKIPVDQRPTLSAFLRSDQLERLTRNWSTYTIDDRVVADHVCRYEELDAALAATGTALGLPGRLSLPHAKGQVRPDRRAARELLDDADLAVVRAKFARELETFGYQP
ncbi:sulfotransferase family 2 domain-containing protein [Jatrophihabitans sp. YIM 134969]